MFENLYARLQIIFKKLTGRGKLSEEDINQALRDIRIALLEADVNLKVSKDFITRCKEKAMGEEVLRSLTPGQQVIKIVNQELTHLLGGTRSELNLGTSLPDIIMLVGLYGGGKTTTAAKLAYLLKSQRHKPLLVSTDVHRPAAFEQLKAIGEQIKVTVFQASNSKTPVRIAEESIKYARANQHDVIIIDTAGRFHIEEGLMQEMAELKAAIAPTEILLVVDATTGQDAVNIGTQFEQQLGLDGLVLTKLDGDARGGAALSLKAVTGKPIKFVGIGEKLDAFEPFYPDRMAARILGMGDVLTLVERASTLYQFEEAQKMEEKLRKGEFNLNDFLEQIQTMNKLGSLEQILSWIPGISKLTKSAPLKFEEKRLIHMEAIIKSMTREERKNPDILNAKRKRRVAQGSGTSIQDVNILLSQFWQLKQLTQGLDRLPRGFDLGDIFTRR